MSGSVNPSNNGPFWQGLVIYAGSPLWAIKTFYSNSSVPLVVTNEFNIFLLRTASRVNGTIPDWISLATALKAVNDLTDSAIGFIMSRSFFTPDFVSYIAPAQFKPQLWRLIVGLILFFVIYIGIVIGLATVTSAFGLAGMTSTEMNLNTRGSMIEALLGFGGGILGVWAAVVLLHRRSLVSVVGPLSDVRRNFLIAAGVVGVGQSIWMLISAYFVGTQPNLPLTSVLLFLPLAAILLFIQTGAEEILFRGYLMQQLAARFKSPIIWLALPSVAFGLVHYDPETMQHMVWWVVIAITVSGFAWADLTRVTGNLGAAWGWHFMNNFMLLNFVTLPGTMTGFVWKTTGVGIEDLTAWLILPEIGFSVGVWLLLRRALRPCRL